MKYKCPHCDKEQEVNATGNVAFCEFCYLAFSLCEK
jgi:hypothetical protein